MVDERHVGTEDLPASNLMATVLGLEQSRTPGDLVRVAEWLVEWLRDSRDDGLKRAFADWVRQMAEGFVPDDAALPAVETLEGVRMTSVLPRGLTRLFFLPVCGGDAFVARMGAGPAAYSGPK